MRLGIKYEAKVYTLVIHSHIECVLPPATMQEVPVNLICMTWMMFDFIVGGIDNMNRTERKEASPLRPPQTEVEAAVLRTRREAAGIVPWQWRMGNLLLLRG
mmetsp:Transcript_10163/g.18333  ORF Transcript_10163/g.18333 Transcript_10163/m.18333 type:complete len:102 (-) Transcript_10163:35-340(-)